MEKMRSEKRIIEENKLILRVISYDKSLEHKKVSYTLTKDISLGGISIQTDTFLPIDTVVEIKLSLGKMPKIICVRAKVRWIKTLFCNELFRVGLEFADLSLNATSSLKSHLYEK